MLLQTNSLTEEQLKEVIFSKGTRNKDNAFWFDISTCEHTSLISWMLTCFEAAMLPQRPVIAVYHYVRRSHHPMAQQGKWTQDEDDLLRQ